MTICSPPTPLLSTSRLRARYFGVLQMVLTSPTSNLGWSVLQMSWKFGGLLQQNTYLVVQIPALVFASFATLSSKICLSFLSVSFSERRFLNCSWSSLNSPWRKLLLFLSKLLLFLSLINLRHTAPYSFSMFWKTRKWCRTDWDTETETLRLGHWDWDTETETLRMTHLY